MKEDLVKRLKNKYPEILEKSYGFSFEDGWYNLVDVACHLIQSRLKIISKQNEFKFTQLKEKFGGLRMYKEGYCDDYIDGVLNIVESLSFRTCEITGSVGFRCYNGGYLRTLCPEQMEKLGFKGEKITY